MALGGVVLQGALSIPWVSCWVEGEEESTARRLLTFLQLAIGLARPCRVEIGQLLLHVIKDPHGVVLLVSLDPVSAPHCWGEGSELETPLVQILSGRGRHYQ